MDGKKYSFERNQGKGITHQTDRDFISREARARLAARIRLNESSEGRSISYSEAERRAHRMADAEAAKGRK